MTRKNMKAIQTWMTKFGLPQSDAEIVEELGPRIPKADKIVEESGALGEKDQQEPGYVKENFGISATSLFSKAYSKYQEYEKQGISVVVDLWIDSHKDLIDRLSRESKDHSDFLKRIGPYLTPFLGAIQMKASQMRRSRGGRSLEIVTGTLLEKIGVKVARPEGTEARRKLKRIDLVVPDQKTALETPDRAFFISCKTTLRERWKQTIPERQPAWRVFLITLDDNLPSEKAEEVNQLGIIAFVKDEVKARAHLKEKQWIRRLSDLPTEFGVN